MTTDLIIVGAGPAGMAAAIAATDAGGSVILLDKQPAIGGQLPVSGGHFAGAATHRQALAGVSDSPDAHYDDVIRISHGLSDPALVRRSVDLLGEMVDWLEAIGFPFAADTPRLVWGHEVYGEARTYYGPAGGKDILATLAPQVARRPIDVRTSTSVQSLIVEDSAVRGVRATGPDGITIELRARNVILATGGYGASRLMRDRFLDPSVRSVLAGCLDHATGDGVRMAEEAGAEVTGTGFFLPQMGCIPDPDRPGFTLGYDEARIIPTAAYRTVSEIWVNRGGDRFVAEDTRSPEDRERALVAQPDMWMAVIWDEAILDSADPLLTADSGHWSKDRVRTEADRGRYLFRADTLDDLARVIGVPADRLAASVAGYNAAVAGAADPLGRTTLPLPIQTPPFYAVVSQGAVLLTHDGVRVNDRLEVVRPDGSIIPGLYAVGEVLGGSRLMGDSFVSGMSVGPALAFGRWLGGRLARVE